MSSLKDWHLYLQLTSLRLGVIMATTAIIYITVAMKPADVTSREKHVYYVPVVAVRCGSGKLKSSSWSRRFRSSATGSPE